MVEAARQPGSQVKTNFVSRIDARAGEARHFLIIHEPDAQKRWVVVGQAQLTIGRYPPADIVVTDTAASRMHCVIELIEDEVFVRDLSSTNGTFVDGRRITASTPLRSGTVIQIGNQIIGYERRLVGDVEELEALGRDLQSASRYIQLLLPRPVHEGPVQADWHFLPCAHVGGDAFGYGPIHDGWWGGFMLDVTGHGAGAALHAATLLNVLRRRATPGVDLRDPGAVIGALNEMFEAESNDVPLFSIWGFTYEIKSRTLRYSSAGHHAGYLRSPREGAPVPLNTSNPLAGMIPGKKFAVGAQVLPRDAMLYLFSDGVFEIADPSGNMLTLKDFLPVLGQPPARLAEEPARIYRHVRSLAKPGPLADDLSILVLSFP